MGTERETRLNRFSNLKRKRNLAYGAAGALVIAALSAFGTATFRLNSENNEQQQEQEKIHRSVDATYPPPNPKDLMGAQNLLDEIGGKLLEGDTESAISTISQNEQGVKAAGLLVNRNGINRAEKARLETEKDIFNDDEANNVLLASTIGIMAAAVISFSAAESYRLKVDKEKLGEALGLT